eukprot:366092-Chlamydomonas_euryale.AAC.11
MAPALVCMCARGKILQASIHPPTTTYGSTHPSLYSNEEGQSKQPKRTATPRFRRRTNSRPPCRTGSAAAPPWRSLHRCVWQKSNSEALKNLNAWKPLEAPGNNATILKSGTALQDSFYRDLSGEEQAMAAQKGYNFDHPDAFDKQAMMHCLSELKNPFSALTPFTPPAGDDVLSQLKVWLTMHVSDL